MKYDDGRGGIYFLGEAEVYLYLLCDSIFGEMFKELEKLLKGRVTLNLALAAPTCYSASVFGLASSSKHLYSSYFISSDTVFILCGKLRFNFHGTPPAMLPKNHSLNSS